MSKAEGKKTKSPADTRQPQANTNPKKASTAKQKRKQWLIDMNKKERKPSPKAKQKAVSQPSLPSKDQFSCNWKTFLEVLNASKPKETEPATPKHQNSAVHKKEATDRKSENISKNSFHPRQTDTGGRVKHKPAPKSVAPKSVAPKESEVKLKDPGVSETRRSAAPKRKKDGGESNSKQPAKKKKKKEKKNDNNKTVAEETKHTEDDLWFDDVDPDDIEATIGAEAAEIMRKKLGLHKNTDTEAALVKTESFAGLTKAVAIDCEMVGVGENGVDSMLARVSMVNQFGKCIYDKYVKPTEKVTDYRTAVSGIRPEDIKNGEDIQTVQREVAEIMRGRIVVGHAIHNDLKILLLDHPKKFIRDTQKYNPFKKTVKRSRPGLRLLCKEILNVNIQQGSHSSVQDAQATMRLYTLVKKHWEANLKAKKDAKKGQSEDKRAKDDKVTLENNKC